MGTHSRVTHSKWIAYVQYSLVCQNSQIVLTIEFRLFSIKTKVGAYSKGALIPGCTYLIFMCVHSPLIVGGLIDRGSEVHMKSLI